nr:GNAT family N-acetyltransferase [Marinicella rhabdoformis]
MLADDPLGALREDAQLPLNSKYSDAFQAISSDPNNELMVLTSDGGTIGMLQLTFIPYLTHVGSWRCLVEGVRVHKDFRGQGLGAELIQWSIDRAKERHCKMIQLTSDKQRPEALRFYEMLGFKANHEGFKLKL